MLLYHATENPIGFRPHGASEGILLKMTEGSSTFSWQRGYGAFSVSQSHVDALISYIQKQEEHHRTITFEEEFRLMLKRYAMSSSIRSGGRPAASSAAKLRFKIA